MLDVIEIDAASNTWVDNIRDLIEKSRFEPSQWKYKVYIIDEVHMLSDGAFNALLKTLEEPPSHVKFILATTEIDKVPETIRSRTLRFDFHKISTDEIIGRLEYVVKSEKIEASNSSLRIIAESARGWMRDALTILEQQSMWGSIDERTLRENLSLIEEGLLMNILDILIYKKYDDFLELISNLRKKHIKVDALFDQMLYSLRDKMLADIHSPLFDDYSNISRIIEDAYTKIRFLPDGLLLIEITLLRILRRDNETVIPLEKIVENKDWEQLQKEIKTPSVAREEIITVPKEEAKKWDEWKENFSYISLLSKVKETKPALAIDLKSARFEVDGRKLTLIFEKDWNFQRVNTPIIKNSLIEILDALFLPGWSLFCELSWGTRVVEEWVF